MPYNSANAVSFAQRQSQRYGDGECWTLVEDSIVRAGGKSSRILTPNFGPNSSYVWGTPLALTALQPGDALQFLNYSWTETTSVDVTNPDGSGGTNETTQTEARGLPNHSALVVRVISSGIVEAIEQNIPPRTGPVQTTRLVLIAPPDSTTTTREPRGTGFVVTVTTVTHSVSGVVRGYRPISA